MRTILIQQGLDAALETDEDSRAKKGNEEGSTSSGGDMKITTTRLTLYTFSMKTRTTLKDHIDEFNNLILDLENVNIIFEDENRALILLSSLPDSYEHFMDTLLNERQSLTLKDMKDALKSKDLKKRTEMKDQNLDCFEKKKLEKIQKESTGKAAVASEDERDTEDADVLLATDKHLTYGGKVLLGNNLACKVVGLGTVSVNMFDGVSKDLEQIMNKGTVIIKGIRMNGLYVLVGALSKPGKSEALEKFKEWTALMENQVVRKVKRLRTYNGLEFCSISTTAYLINRSPSSALIFKTPQEAWSGKPPDISNLKIFGCPAYAHVSQGKLEPRTVKGYFIGYPEGIKGYKIWSIDRKPSRTFISRDVVFNEDALPQLKEGITGVEKPRYKARLVAKGFTQRKGVDFNKVFSPVVKHSSIRILLAITAVLDLALDQMDVQTAFLHRNLAEKIFMSQLEGFIEE
ncbi:hypothetical protein KPL71_007181 [Citrus sinensis]|uniref:Uncharacterized protein n=1 Tax=Citrus sinensis TaxID=2711 RepID=A0ACB8LXB1_CITSI|nr:hypothetical protein KPL71_007181 [Citrus sinensis]